MATPPNWPTGDDAEPENNNLEESRETDILSHRLSHNTESNDLLVKRSIIERSIRPSLQKYIIYYVGDDKELVQNIVNYAFYSVWNRADIDYNNISRIRLHAVSSIQRHLEILRRDIERKSRDDNKSLEIPSLDWKSIYGDGDKVENKPTYPLEYYLDGLGISLPVQEFIRNIVAEATAHPELTPNELKARLGIEQGSASGEAHPAPDPGPMPTFEELQKAGKLYSQAYAADRSTDIIKHLRAVWMPWIEAGVLTQPELRKKNRDPSAYKALVVWPGRTGKSLKAELGYDIPSKSEVIDSHIAAVAALPPGERPAKVSWVIDKRARKDSEPSR